MCIRDRGVFGPWWCVGCVWRCCMQINNLNDQEIRLEILRMVKETGSEQQKNDPLPFAEKYYNWVVGKKIR